MNLHKSPGLTIVGPSAAVVLGQVIVPPTLVGAAVTPEVPGNGTAGPVVSNFEQADFGATHEGDPLETFSRRRQESIARTVRETAIERGRFSRSLLGRIADHFAG